MGGDQGSVESVGRFGSRCIDFFACLTRESVDGSVVVPPLLCHQTTTNRYCGTAHSCSHLIHTYVAPCRPAQALRMFSWRDSQAHLLHALPAALSLGLPLFTPLPTLPGAKQPPGLWTAYRLLAAATQRSLLSVVLAVVLPAAMGIARVLLSGRWRSGWNASSVARGSNTL